MRVEKEVRMKLTSKPSTNNLQVWRPWLALGLRSLDSILLGCLSAKVYEVSKHMLTVNRSDAPMQ